MCQLCVLNLSYVSYVEFLQEIRFFVLRTNLERDLEKLVNIMLIVKLRTNVQWVSQLMLQVYGKS